jgi:hypothetical protein
MYKIGKNNPEIGSYMYGIGKINPKIDVWN